MEIELGLKVSRPTGDESIFTNLRISKDACNPLFLSIETKAIFILTANLKGYPREKLKIDINGDGTEIAIRGEKGTDEVVIGGFRNVFRIPAGVVLDGINATFNQEESVLKILMPKSVKGISGVGIEEVETRPTRADEAEAAKTEADIDHQVKTDELLEEHKPLDQVEQQQDDGAETDELQPPQETAVDDHDRKGSLAPSTKSKLCSPCFLAGSAILVSIMAVLIHFIRPKGRR